MRLKAIRQCFIDDKDLWSTNKTLRELCIKPVKKTEYNYIGRDLIDELRRDIQLNEKYKLITRISKHVF